MKINLLEALAQVPDFRAPRGRRYPLQLMKAAGDHGNAEQLLRISSLRGFCPSPSPSLGGTLKVTTDAFSLRLDLSTGNDGDQFYSGSPKYSLTGQGIGCQAKNTIG
jgi:hypothetical protein